MASSKRQPGGKCSAWQYHSLPPRRRSVRLRLCACGSPHHPGGAQPPLSLRWQHMVTALQSVPPSLHAAPCDQQAAEREQLRSAIVRAQAVGVAAVKVSSAEGSFRLAVERAEAAVAEERAAAERAIREEREKEERAVQMQQAREILRRSVSRPAEERKKILRELQVS